MQPIQAEVMGDWAFVFEYSLLLKQNCLFRSDIPEADADAAQAVV